jgi:hypothetical protein
MTSKQKLLFIGFIFCMLMNYSACRSDNAARPLATTEFTHLSLPIEGLTFLAKGKQWSAELLTFTQPIKLNIDYTNTGFVVSSNHQMGIIEGPGILCLKSGDNHFFYDVWLNNKQSAPYEMIDMRSPKTVNPDSSLHQQRIVYAIDEWSNIVRLNEREQHFEEEEVFLPPKAGIYQAQENNPISAFNVQPGSCVSIPLKAELKKGDQQVLVKAGPLKDQFNNLVADGTLVTFVYDDGQYTYRTESALINGFAQTEIPIDIRNVFQLYAQVHTTRSTTIQLN